MSACVYLFLLLVEELSGEELLLALLTVSEVVVVFKKTLFPGTVRGLFTAANTGAGFGWTETRRRRWRSYDWHISSHTLGICIEVQQVHKTTVILTFFVFCVYLSSEQHLSHLCGQILFIIFEVLHGEIKAKIRVIDIFKHTFCPPHRCKCVSQLAEKQNACLVLYNKELGGQDRIFGRVQVTGSAFVGHNKQSNVADNVQLL